MKMAQDQRVVFGPFEVHPIAVSSRDQLLGPHYGILERESGKFSGEAPVMVASHGNYFGTGSDLSENVLNPGPFLCAGTRSVDDIAHEYKPSRLNLIAHGHQLFAGSFIG